MSELVKVDKISLTIGDQQISITPTEARSLKEVLDNLFEKEVIIQKEYVPILTPAQPFPNPQPFPSPVWYSNSTGNDSMIRTSDGLVTCTYQVIK